MLRISAIVARLTSDCAVLLLEDVVDDEQGGHVSIAVRNKRLLPRFVKGARWDVYLEPRLSEKQLKKRYEEWRKRAEKVEGD